MSLRKGLRGSGLLFAGSQLGHPFLGGSVSGALGCTVDVGQKMQARERVQTPDGCRGTHRDVAIRENVIAWFVACLGSSLIHPLLGGSYPQVRWVAQVLQGRRCRQESECRHQMDAGARNETLPSGKMS
jgi:hypothetical protein